MKYFPKKVLGHKIFSSMISWPTNFYFEKSVKHSAPPPSPPSYILDVCSLSLEHDLE